jgi:hypothetical protein
MSAISGWKQAKRSTFKRQKGQSDFISGVEALKSCTWAEVMLDVSL